MCQPASSSKEEECEITSSSVALKDQDCHCEQCQDTTATAIASTITTAAAKRVVSPGDIVTIDLTMTPENGLVPEPLFDRTGVITFVVGWGNYLPGLHELVQGKGIGDTVNHVSIDAGWGDRNPELIMEIPVAKLKRFRNEQDGRFPAVVTLQGGIQLSIVQVKDDTQTVIVDANPPLAGASYDCSFTILSIDNLPQDALQEGRSSVQQQQQQQQQQSSSSRYKVSTWALGCFWGGELAFMRVPGVVGTRVGYTQGIVSHPSYEDVCTGKTHHREAIMVVYDPEAVSYQQLVEVAMSRLAATNTISHHNPKNKNNTDTMFGDLFAEEEDERDNKQYRHGFYYHSEDQRVVAQDALNVSNPYDIEMKKVAIFYDAEDYHQQYLLKGGQSARKGAKEAIRCYG